MKSGPIADAALDVYEEEAFFRDLSGQIIQDNVLTRLLSCPSVPVTSHQAFLTNEALQNVVDTTPGNLTNFADGKPMQHALLPGQSPFTAVRK